MVEGERRREIVRAYTALPHVGPKTDRCVNFVKFTCKCRSLSHFLDTAKESNVTRLEQILYG